MSDTIDLETKVSTALSLFVDGRFDDAYRTVLDAVEASPGDPDLWQLLGAIALRGGRPLRAYHAFTRQRELQDDVHTQLLQLLAAYYAIDVSAARAHAKEVFERHPDNAEARAWVAKMDQITDEHDLLIDVGRALCRQGRHVDAIDFFVAAIEARETAPARLWLGRAFLALGEAGNAIPLLESAAADIPEDPTIGVDVATAYSVGGRNDIAHAWLDEARRVHPSSAEVHEAIARLALDEGNLAAAASAVEAALAAGPDSDGAWLAAAGVYEVAGNIERARIAVDRSLALDPARLEAWNLGARIVRADGDAGLASHYQAMVARLAGAEPIETQQSGSLQDEIDRLYRYVRQDPLQVGTYRDRATINALLGLFDRALYYLDLVIRDVAHGATPELVRERGALLRQLGRIDEADAALSGADQTGPASS